MRENVLLDTLDLSKTQKIFEVPALTINRALDIKKVDKLSRMLSFVSTINDCCLVKNGDLV